MKLHTTLILALSLAVMGPTYAAEPGDAMKERAEDCSDASKAAAKQKAAKDRCDSLSGNAKEVCLKDATAEYSRPDSRAMADEKSIDPQIDSQSESREDQTKAQYKASKEECDALSGSAKVACINSPTVQYHQ